MTKEQAEFLKNAIKNGGEDCEVHPEYSGRGMSGKTTYAVSFSGIIWVLPLIIDECRAIARRVIGDIDGGEEYLDKKIPEFNSLRQDNLGNSVILY